MKATILSLCLLPFFVFANTNESGKMKADILLVVDNSMSMKEIQTTLKNNINTYFQQLNSIYNFDWKLGVISTSKGETPYLGFEKVFDSQTENKVELFKEAIDKMGINGDYREVSYDNVMRALLNFPNFSRAQTNEKLILIFATDEDEQSTIYNPESFLKAVKTIYGENAIIKAYGIFGFNGMEGCVNSYSPNYKESSFKQVIDATGGFAISACSNTFDIDLTKIVEDL